MLNYNNENGDNMSRYTLQFVSPFQPQQVNDFFATYLTNEGFQLKTDKNGSYWKKGVGLLTAPQYVKLSCQNNTYVIEAWLKFALLPGVYIGEMGFDGFFGCIPKSMLKSRVDSILASLQARPLQLMQGYPNMPQQPQGNFNATPNMPQQIQGNYYANPNVPPQVQGNYYANPNMPPQAQGNYYNNANIPMQPQMQNNPVAQPVNNQPVNNQSVNQ